MVREAAGATATAKEVHVPTRGSGCCQVAGSEKDGLDRGRVGLWRLFVSPGASAAQAALHEFASTSMARIAYRVLLVLGPSRYLPSAL